MSAKLNHINLNSHNIECKKPWEKQNISSHSEARKIINVNLPKFKIDDIRLLGEGWDNTTWLVNGHLCFRFPKHEEAAALLLNEVKVLSQSLELTLNIPSPAYICLSPKQFEYPFYAHSLIGGTTADKANLSLEERFCTAKPLAVFLKKLHTYSVDSCLAKGIGYDQIGRLNVKARFAQVKDRLEYLLRHEIFTNFCEIIDFYEQHMNTISPKNFVLGHGDLYAKHLIIRKTKELVGVIDWGDSELLHPAVDLAIVYQFLPEEAHQMFWDIYGKVDNNTHVLAKLRAIYSSVTISWYAHQVQDISLMKEGILGLKMILKNIQ
ncbi:aminoglycoside phosphotransferase family protein [Francisellaceae bacterium]|nr:aminoglycoside phosphotransferase family protein [Francisellaceae bacterium]